MVRRNTSGTGFFDSTRAGRCSRIVRSWISKVRQAAVMSHNAACHFIFSDLCAFYCAGCGVVYFEASIKPFLEGLRALSDIMRVSQKASSILFSEFCSKPSTKLRRSLQMILHGLCPSVLRNMRQIHLLHRPALLYFFFKIAHWALFVNNLTFFCAKKVCHCLFCCKRQAYP